MTSAYLLQHEPRAGPAAGGRRSTRSGSSAMTAERADDAGRAGGDRRGEGATASWSKLDASEALTVPRDLATSLRGYPDAKRHFDAFPPSARKVILDVDRRREASRDPGEAGRRRPRGWRTRTSARTNPGRTASPAVRMRRPPDRAERRDGDDGDQHQQGRHRVGLADRRGARLAEEPDDRDRHRRASRRARGTPSRRTRPSADREREGGGGRDRRGRDAQHDVARRLPAATRRGRPPARRGPRGAVVDRRARRSGSRTGSRPPPARAARATATRGDRAGDRGRRGRTPGRA